ncbi:MAG: glycosyltransferase [Tepidisphaeraceae bacterium]|jgi:UDP:flavonoid glycosyltransferase YjiC (YdhE family)
MPKSALRILIAALGSHGDVHPFLAMGQTLRGRGHDVRIIAPAMYETLANSLGLQFVPVGSVELFERHAARPELWRPVRGFGVMAEAVADLIEPYYDAIERNHQRGATGLVLSSLVLGGRVAQEALGIPAVSVHLSPAILRSLQSPAKTPPLPVSGRLPGWWNRLVYWAVDALVMDRALAGPLNDFRRSLGLPPVKRLFNGWVHSPDRVIGLFPDWFAPPPRDWPRQTVLSGFPLYDESDVIGVDPDIEKFLMAGQPPIAFTPGSAMRHGERFFAEALRTCGILGCRGVLLSRHAQHVPANLPPEVRHVDYVPFSRLLPDCAALVHHGGIGTAAQGLAAGIPQLVVPMAHDQPDNAARLKRLGVAEVLPARRFRAAPAAAALKLAMDEFHRAACVSIKQRLAAENPLAKTAEIIEETFAQKYPRRAGG